MANDSVIERRTSVEEASAAIRAWLDEHAPGHPEFSLCEDGDSNSAPNKCGWAFWIAPMDTTSCTKTCVLSGTVPAVPLSSVMTQKQATGQKSSHPNLNRIKGHLCQDLPAFIFLWICTRPSRKPCLKQRRLLALNWPGIGQMNSS